MNLQIIPFSGSCLSGKTTTMFYLKQKLEDNGYKVAIAGEPIRKILDELNISIDELRNDVDKFLLVQNRVLDERMRNEVIDVYEKYKDYNFLFIDRSAADVFFYVSFYFDKKLLKTDEQVSGYTQLLNAINFYVDQSSQIYSKIFLFKPLNKIIINDDSYRPKDISEERKYMEYQMISLYNKLFFKKVVKRIDVDLNNKNELDKLSKMFNVL